MFTVNLRKERNKFSSAHFTLFPDGSVEKLHGHNYFVEVEFEATTATTSPKTATPAPQPAPTTVIRVESDGTGGANGVGANSFGNQTPSHPLTPGKDLSGGGVLQMGILFPFDKAKKLIFELAMLWDERVLIPTVSNVALPIFIPRLCE